MHGTVLLCGNVQRRVTIRDTGQPATCLVLQCKGYATCYSAKDTLSATVQRIRYVRRLSPAYDSCSRSRRGEKSCLWARWRGKQDQMGETIAQAKRQVGVKGSDKNLVKFRI